MFNTTIKRSVATLGVVAGLLAAAGPASAQILEGPVLAKAGPQPEAGGYLATDPSSEVDNQMRLSISGAEAAGFVKAPANATSVSTEAVDINGELQPDLVATDEVFELNTFGLTEHEGAAGRGPLETVSFTIKGAAFRGEVIGLEPNALGTQVGSEGVKAPANAADDQMKYYLEQAWPVTGDAGSGANNLRGEAIDIIP